ncbi:MAG: hypothetical protein IBX55_11615 [Methyloprofundus sp.]|nr:hypothetical protein [Methyloprofundus sp.]
MKTNKIQQKTVAILLLTGLFSFSIGLALGFMVCSGSDGDTKHVLINQDPSQDLKMLTLANPAYSPENALNMAKLHLPTTKWLGAVESTYAPGLIELQTNNRTANFYYEPRTGYFLIGLIINPYNKNGQIAQGEFSSEE